jgi:hypothetical protein
MCAVSDRYPPEEAINTIALRARADIALSTSSRRVDRVLTHLVTQTCTGHQVHCTIAAPLRSAEWPLVIPRSFHAYA